MKEITTDRIIIVGAGVGALFAALKLAPRPVLVISPEALGKGASSALAQGGVAAAMHEADSPESHAADTIQAGAGAVDPEVATLVTQHARDYVLDLTNMGAPFDRTKEGEYMLSREAAHSFARVVRVKGDQSGTEIMAALIEQVRECPSIQVIEGSTAVTLDVIDGRVVGISVQDADNGSASVMLRGSAYLLAGGGSGGLYAATTNPPRIRGQVIGMAARAGAAISDAEFVQFHPTAMDIGEDPAPLATEALRGEGAKLVNKDGERFMVAIHRDAELAPRDVVARAIFSQSQAGKRPMLDTREALGDNVQTMFPALMDACTRNGIDPVQQPIPIAAAAHYHMGGIMTDIVGRASLKNLWICGEASSTGLHGANRLASNGLLEALVFARICAEDIRATTTDVATSALLDIRFDVRENASDTEAVAALRQTMTTFVGVVRNHDGLCEALRRIASLESEHPANLPFLNMCATATLIAASALLREESRGAHEREDFPEISTEPWKRSPIYLSDAIALRTQIVEEQS